MNSNIQISILGREYSFRSQESEDQVQRVVRFVEEKLAEMGSGTSVDTRDLTVLTLLNLAGQYLQLLDQKEQGSESQDRRLRLLVEHLERAVIDNSGC